MKKLLFIAVVMLGLLPASIASAHDPIILTSEQQTPADGPLLVDGTISFALYGSLDTGGDTRGFRVQFKEGDPLSISILNDIHHMHQIRQKILSITDGLQPVHLLFTIPFGSAC